MRYTWKTIGKRLVGLFLVLSVSVAAVYFGGAKAIENAIQTAVIKQPYEPPVIVLDAGHGECS